MHGDATVNVFCSISAQRAGALGALHDVEPGAGAHLALEAPRGRGAEADRGVRGQR